MNPLYPAVAERAGERCEYCRAPERVFNFAFEVEHIQPRATGGSDDLNNLALACESCNLHKSTTTTGWDETEAQDVSRSTLVCIPGTSIFAMTAQRVNCTGLRQ